MNTWPVASYVLNSASKFNPYRTISRGLIRFLLSHRLAGSSYVGVRYYQDGKLPPRSRSERFEQAGPIPTEELIRLADAASLRPTPATCSIAPSRRSTATGRCSRRTAIAPNVPDSSVELACYAPSDNRIFILRIDDPQLKSEMASRRRTKCRTPPTAR